MYYTPVLYPFKASTFALFYRLWKDQSWKRVSDLAIEKSAP